MNNYTKHPEETAQQQINSGDFSAAVSSYREIVTLNPGNAEAWLIPGQLQHAIGNLDEAKRSALHSVEINFEYVEAWLFLSGIAGQLGEYEQAPENIIQVRLIRNWQ